MEFFKHQPAGSDIVWAGRFTKATWPSPEAKAVWDYLNRPTPDSKPILERIAVRLSHLGKNRGQYDHEWNCNELVQDLGKLMQLFFEDLKDEFKPIMNNLLGNMGA